MSAGCMTLSVCGCGKPNAENPAPPSIPIIIEDDTNVIDTNTNGADIGDAGSGGTASDTEDTTAPVSDDTTLSFDNLSYLTFFFSSGAGGWSTAMSIRSDGTFAGEYHDSDMGVTGDDYPNGTAYHCTFNGQFSQPVKVNDYTYSMQILSMSYANEPDTSEIKDDTLYHYTTPYGLDGAETLLLYLPGAPLSELPEGYRSWVGYYYLENTTDTELPYYGLYNEAEAEGFSSYAEAEALKADLSYVETRAEEIENIIENDASLTQADLNGNAGELYELWDSYLNRIWNALRRMNDAETMRALTDEQLTWIAGKEAAVTEAGAEFEGGSLYPLVTNMKAAELTKARVYELLALLEA